MMFASVSEHFANLRHVKDAKLVCRARMQYLEVPKLWSVHYSPLDPKWCLGVFQSISLTFTTWKMQNSYFGPECTILGYESCEASILVHLTKMMFVSVSDDFTNFRQEQGAKLLFKPECTILGYRRCEASILVHWTQNDVCECFRWFL
jgi:hypothetical protein